MHTYAIPYPHPGVDPEQIRETIAKSDLPFESLNTFGTERCEVSFSKPLTDEQKESLRAMVTAIKPVQDYRRKRAMDELERINAMIDGIDSIQGVKTFLKKLVRRVQTGEAIE